MEPWPDRLARLRNATGLTQAQVADYFNIKPASVAQWEGTGGKTTRPAIDKLARLARLYHVDLDVLCGLDFPLVAARRAAGESNVLPFPGLHIDPPASREDIDDIVQDPEMWRWIFILRHIKQEDRALLSEMIRRWVDLPKSIRKA